MATSAVAAQHIFLGASRFRDLVAAGVITRQKSGGYKLDMVREEYCLHMQKIAAGRAADGGASLSAKRARLAEAQAEAAEFKNIQMRGGFVELPMVQNLLGEMFGVMREIALSVPGKISDGLQPHTPKDRGAIYEVVKSEIYDMLNNLADPDKMDAAMFEKQKGNR
jgi:phage terminase Nu1 subunit (DNA packaging protein)